MTWAWYSSWLISSAARSAPSCSAAIQDSAASSTSFFPIACTPASSCATVPEPSGRVRAFSDSSAQSPSNVFTTGQPSCAGASTRSHVPAWTGQDGAVTRSIADLDWPVRTARLTLRPAEQRDAASTFAFRRLPDVAHWLTVHTTDLEAWEAGFGERLADTFVVELDGVVIGDLM